MKFLLLFSIFILSMKLAISNESERIYSTADGDIQVSSLENAISTRLNKKKVTVTRIRNSYDPRDFAITLLFEYDSYVIHFNVDDVHKVKCDFTLIQDNQRIMLTECTSKTANITIIDFIRYSEVGLATRITL